MKSTSIPAWDVLVRLKKVGGENGTSARSGVPIGRVFRGFLSKECLNEKGLPLIGSRVEIDGIFSSSPLQSITEQTSESFKLKTQSGEYEMTIERRTKLRSRI